jgi:hypothetical protein
MGQNTSALKARILDRTSARGSKRQKASTSTPAVKVDAAYVSKYEPRVLLQLHLN